MGNGFPFVHICNKPIMGQSEPIAISTMPIWGMDGIGWMENTYLLDTNSVVNTNRNSILFQPKKQWLVVINDSINGHSHIWQLHYLLGINMNNKFLIYMIDGWFKLTKLTYFIHFPSTIFTCYGFQVCVRE